MAYDTYLEERIDRLMEVNKALPRKIKMMGGLCYMVDEKMCFGLIHLKKKGMNLLMARIGPEATEIALNKVGCHPMDFTGRPMKGYVFVDEEGYDMEDDLAYWIDLCLAYNPMAKSSKKKKTQAKK